jgi:hypothetical protein
LGHATGSPVDNATYNLLQALVSKLEAIEAYGKYEHDSDGELFRELGQEERRQADLLLDALRERLASRGGDMAMSGRGREPGHQR